TTRSCSAKAPARIASASRSWPSGSSASAAEESLGGVAPGPHDPAPVAKRSPGQEPLVGQPVPAVADDRVRDVPALPAGLRGPVREVDLLAVHAEAGVVTAELVQHR